MESRAPPTRSLRLWCRRCDCAFRCLSLRMYAVHGHTTGVGDQACTPCSVIGQRLPCAIAEARIALDSQKPLRDLVANERREGYLDLFLLQSPDHECEQGLRQQKLAELA